LLSAGLPAGPQRPAAPRSAAGVLLLHMNPRSLVAIRAAEPRWSSMRS